MSTRMVVRAAACALAFAGMLQATASPASAQQPTTKTAPESAPRPARAAPAPAAFDRTVIPPAGTAPELRVPAWTTDKLSNGAQLIVSQRHNLPLVSFTITWVGGAYQYMPADKTGLASFTGPLLPGR